MRHRTDAVQTPYLAAGPRDYALCAACRGIAGVHFRKCPKRPGVMPDALTAEHPPLSP